MRSSGASKDEFQKGERRHRRDSAGFEPDLAAQPLHGAENTAKGARGQAQARANGPSEGEPLQPAPDVDRELGLSGAR